MNTELKNFSELKTKDSLAIVRIFDSYTTKGYKRLPFLHLTAGVDESILQHGE